MMKQIADLRDTRTIPTRTSFLPLSRPDIGEEEKAEVLDTLNSDWLSKGPKTKKFEEQFKDYVGAKHAIALSSCTAALHIALLTVGVMPGDEVITSPLTFIATGNAILYVGAKPVFVDIQRDTYNMDPELLEQRITEKTKAIIPVHFAGLPCEMDDIQKIAKKYQIPIIEDAAHAIGASFKGKKVGNIGDITCFSFYATKTLTTGDGGLITTNNEDFARKLEILSLHGMSTGAWQRYSPTGSAKWEMVELGYKYNMTDIQASLGIHQLAKIDSFVKKREDIFCFYDKMLKEIPEIQIPASRGYCKHARYIYPIVLRTEKLTAGRLELINHLKAENIGTGIHFISIHLQPYYEKLFGFKPEAFQNALYVSDRILSLPLFTKMTENDAYYVVNKIKGFIQKYCV